MDVLRASHMRLQQRCHDAEAHVERLLAENQRLRDALANVGDGMLGNVCWCGPDWLGEDDPLDPEREHAEWCRAARSALDGSDA